MKTFSEEAEATICEETASEGEDEAPPSEGEGTESQEEAPATGAEFVVLDDESILEGFSYRGSSFRIEGAQQGSLPCTEAISVSIVPNDTSVNPADFEDIQVDIFSTSGSAPPVKIWVTGSNPILVPSDAGLSSGEYQVSVCVGGHQVGEPIRIALTDAPPITDADLALCQLLSTQLDVQQTTGFSRLAGWLSNSPEPEWEGEDQQLNQSLRRLWVSNSNFADGDGAQFAERKLKLPENQERKLELRRRLKEHMLPRAPPEVPKAAPGIPLEAGIPPLAVLAVLADPSCSVLLIIVFLHSLRVVVTGITVAESYWTSLDQRFEAWRRAEPETSLESLRQLLSADDGPWRGEYEEQCRRTRDVCTATPMRMSTAVVLGLTVWWSQAMMLSASVSVLGAAAAIQAWVGLAAVCWRASEITRKMNGQARHLFQLHKRAVSILTHQEDSCSTQEWQRARSLWEIEVS